MNTPDPEWKNGDDPDEDFGENEWDPIEPDDDIDPAEYDEATRLYERELEREP